MLICWYRQHVFKDLKPYVCTAETCDRASKLYIHSWVWAMHDAAHDDICPSLAHCAFCGAEYQTKGNFYYKHMSKHLREISLSILSQAIDEDGGDKDDDSGDDYQSDMDSQPDGAIAQRVPREEATSLPELSALEPGEPSYGGFVSKVGAGIDMEDDEITSAAVAKASDVESAFALMAELEDTSISAPGEATAPATGSGNENALAELADTGVSAPADATAPAASDDEADLDSIIDRLLKVRGSQPGEPVHLSESEIRWLSNNAQDIFLSQPTLLELDPPIKVSNVYFFLVGSY